MYRCKPRITLLEILLVVAMTAVIAGALSSAFDRGAKDRATCQNNLKELAIAMQVYWTDYDATLPSSAIVSHSRRWNKNDFITFASKKGSLPVAAGTKARTYVQALYPHMRSRDIMFCPSDPVDRNSTQSQVSYWWKCATDKAWYGEGVPHPCKKESDFTYNADQIAFYEHNGWHYGNRKGLRNGTRINVAYMDTHVRMVTLQNATTGDPINCVANSNGEPMYYNFDGNKPRTPDANPPASSTAAHFTDPMQYYDVLP